MTEDKLKYILNNIKYPGLRLNYLRIHDGPNGYIITLLYKSNDMFNIQREFIEKMDVFLDRNLTEQQVLNRIMHKVKMIVEHEVCNFFKYKNKNVINPHDPNNIWEPNDDES